jgi:hypothetical protein
VPTKEAEALLGVMGDEPKVVEVVPGDLATTSVQAAGVATAVGTEVAVATGTVAGRHGRHGRNSE